MVRRRFAPVLAAAAVAVAIACEPPAQPGSPPRYPDTVPAPRSPHPSEPQVRLIVTLGPGVDADVAAQRLEQDFAGRLIVRRALSEVGHLVVSVDPALRDELSGHPLVAGLEEDFPEPPTG